MTTRTRTAAVLAPAAVLLLAGCGSHNDTEPPAGDDRMQQAAQAAADYQEAYLAEDWQAVCEARTERWRRGTVAECVERTETYPDDEATETGPATTGEPLEVAAAGEHPAGLGVLVSYEVRHNSGNHTSHDALRLVEEDGQWRVDQSEDVEDGTGPDAVIAALAEVD